MRLSIEDGQKSAEQQARAANELYRDAQLKFGRTLDPYYGDVPKGIGLGHLLRVNPSLEVAPTPAADRRRGFMFATVSMAQYAGVSWAQLDKPLSCAYVWGRDINRGAQTLYKSNQTLFTEPNSDFWKCAYLRHVLGEMAFKIIWQARDREITPVYDSLLYVVNALSRALPGWTVIKLRQTVLLGCAYVFELAKRKGAFSSSGFGIEPVLNRNSYTQVFE